MKKGIYLFAVLIAFVIACGVNAHAEEPKVLTDQTEADGIDYLVLVNKQNKLPDYWENTVELETVRKYDDSKDIQVEKKALEKFYELRDALMEEGIDIELDSCYRSVAEQ